jgi:hypothetical protein
MRHKSTQVSFEAYLPVLKQVHALLPASQLVTLRGSSRRMSHERLLHTLQKFQWHFRLRRPCDTLVHLGAHHIAGVKDLCPPAGRTRFFQQVAILGVGVGPVSLALAALLEQPDDP